jgi:nucleotide-binding universal stress UspA family protein
MKLQKIMVAVDLSEPSKAALRYGQFLAQKLGASLDLLHVANPDKVRGDDDVAVLHRGVPGSTLEINNELEIQRKLTAFLKDAGLDRDVRNDEIEQGDDAAETIAELAEKRGYDLIVIGTHGKSGFKRLLAGSVAQKVVNLAKCPVLTYRG